MADDATDDGDAPRDPAYAYKPALIGAHWQLRLTPADRKSTRLNSSHT